MGVINLKYFWDHGVVNMDEMNHLENISKNSLYSAGPNSAMVEYSFKVAARHLSGEALLEMGPAEGVMTDLLVKAGKNVTAIEGSSLFCKNLSERHPGVKVVHTLFEDFQTDAKFDGIVLGHVLEHVNDPVEILLQVKGWLKPGVGKIFAAVPNARSLHRQAAVMMGMLSQEDALNDADVYHGHRRVFNPESFRSLFYQAGLQIEVFGGYWLKPVSNAQIEIGWTAEMLESFMQLGERYPDIAGVLYIIGKNND